jgi:NADPH-dependent glutamate synthase beta subunit-like oxidoreductase
VRLIGLGRFEEALEVVRKVNPFPSVCGRICQHPCEEKCRRAVLDAPVALKELKRFITEVESASEWVPRSLPVTRGKVAVVGAGPAGLTAAQDLREMGYAVTVFERLQRPGGMLNLIPKYRLPEQVLNRDLDMIFARGIELRCNCELGTDLRLSELRSDGYEAIVVSAGLSRSRGLALPGFGAQRFVAAIPLMMDVWLGRPVKVGRKALVVGGGNVAVDVARTIRRLGAEEVTIACVESLSEIPATEEEIAAAHEEGIRLMTSWGPKRILKGDGHVAGMELMRVTSVFDEKGRFDPHYDLAQLKVVTTDMIVLAIGQAGDTRWTRGSEVKLDRRGRLVADRTLHTTSEPGVFLAGEVLHGPGNVIDAIADGHRVASIAEQFIRTGETKPAPDETYRVVGEFPEAVRADLKSLERVPPRQLPVGERLKGFEEHELGYAQAAALREAARCLNCGSGPAIDEQKCAFCLTCFRLCPLDGIEIGKKMRVSPEACQACGLCAAECPQRAITLKHWPNEALREQIAAAVKKQGAAAPSEAVVRCVHAASTRDDLADSPARRGSDGTIRLNVPCVTHLTALDLVLLVAHGVDHIRVEMCPVELCKHPSARERAKQVLSGAAQRARTVRPNVGLAFAEIERPNVEDTAAEGARP